MVKRNRLRNGRPQAAFGVDGAIMAAANIASAIMQAEATKAGAREQAKSIQAQTENNTRLMEQQLDATKQEYEKNRNLQRNLQMSLQMMAGQQNVNEMRDAAKIQVRNGGSSRRKLRKVGSITNTAFLRGNDGNLPFTITDGGGVIPMGYTPEGYALYQVIGKDHEHRNEDNKTGVGIEFPTMPGTTKRNLGGNAANVIEAEGNQNSNLGELMLVTPNDAKFISKHSIKGFNPAKSVLAGMNPIKAFNIQENIKDIYGISDDGKGYSSSPIRSMRFNGGITSPNIIPDLSMDYVVPVATGMMSQLKDDNQARNGRSLKKCGGRKKALFGISKDMWNDEDYKGAKQNLYGNLMGAGVTALANGIGAAFSLAGAKYANNAMNNAINQMHGIDLSKIRREDYRSAHAMAALQDTNVNINPELAMLERDYNRQLTNINRNTLSSAAAIDRSTKAATNYYDLANKLYGEARRIKEGRLAENARMLTQVANENANRDVQANNAYLQAYLHGMEYNADVENRKAELRGQNDADYHLGKGNTLANMTNAIGQSVGNAVDSSLKGFADTSNTIRAEQFAENSVLNGADTENVFRYIQGLKDNDRNRIKKQNFMNFLNTFIDRNDENYKKNKYWLMYSALGGK